MQIRDDIEFTYKIQTDESHKKIYANTDFNHLFLHPSILNKEIKKIETNGPSFHGEIADGKFFVMETKDKIINFEILEMNIKKHFGGKIIIEALKNGELAISNNRNNILFRGLQIYSEKDNYYVYQNSDFKVIVTKQGYFHTAPLEADILSNPPCFMEVIPLSNCKKLYNAYDINCNIVASTTDMDNLNSMLADLEENKMQKYTNPLVTLVTQKCRLYQKFLTLFLIKKFNIPEHYTNALEFKYIVERLLDDNKYCIVDLSSNEIIEGEFRERIEIVNGNTNMWIDEFKEIEQGIEDYKREKIRKEKMNK